MTELEQYIHSYFGVPKEELDKIVSCFHTHTLKKGNYFLKTGRVCDKLSFQRNGLVRVFAESSDREVTQWISTQGYFITDLAGIIFNKTSRWNIQALSDTELFTIHRDNYLKMGQLIPRWHELEKLFIAKCFTMLEDRVFALLSMSTEERYHLLLKEHPQLFNQVPLQYLASMMGMTPETLSRLRKKELKGFS